jgi:hypothetical protein
MGGGREGGRGGRGEREERYLAAALIHAHEHLPRPEDGDDADEL